MGSLALLERAVDQFPREAHLPTEPIKGTTGQVTTGRKKQKPTLRERRAIALADAKRRAERQSLEYIRDEAPNMHPAIKPWSRQRWQPRRTNTSRPVATNTQRSIDQSSTPSNTEARRARRQKRRALKRCVGVTGEAFWVELEMADVAINFRVKAVRTKGAVL